MLFDVTSWMTSRRTPTNSQEKITLALRCSCDTLALRARRGYKLLFLGSSVNDNNDVFILVSFISIAIDSFVSYRLLSN